MSIAARKEKLTKRLLDSLKSDDGEYLVWDTELAGLGVRVFPSGRRSFILKYRNQAGRSKQVTLGAFGKITVEQARQLAKEHSGQIAGGADPIEDRKKARQFETVAELCDRYMKEAKAGRVLSRGKVKKAATLSTDQGRIDRHIKPLLGRRATGDVSRQDVQKFLSDIIAGKTAGTFDNPKKHARSIVKGGPGTAAKAVSLLSAIYNWALRNGMADGNPCLGVEKPADNKRERFLSNDEYRKFGKGLRRARQEGVNPVALAALELIALTGCRRNEVLFLKWKEIDRENQCIRFEDTKTGKQIRPLGKAALALLESLEFESSDWVFPAAKGEGHLVDIRKPCLRVCAYGELPDDITPHILRHSFATTANELNYSEITIAGMIGHNLATITSRYAHNVDNALVSAANAVAGEIATRLQGYPESGANVIAFNKEGGQRGN